MPLFNQIITALEHWLEHLRAASAQADQQTTSISSTEQHAQALGHRLAQLALSHLLASPGTGYDRSARPCSCGKLQRFQRLAPKTIRTLVGPVCYKRAYSRCCSCGESCFPLDDQLGQSEREISPGVERAVALLSAHVSFIEAERLLLELTGVSLSARQIETVAESIGGEAERRQQREEELAATQGLAEVAGPSQPEERTFIVEMDGVQVGLQDGRWQEAKCGVIYESSQRVEMSQGRWELLAKQRCVLRGDVAAFRRRLWALCLRAGIRDSDRVVVLGDGAEWIDQTGSLLLPTATRILDYYHASERVWSVAFARWGEASRQGRRWAEGKLSQLKRGEVRQVLAAMRRLKMKSEESQKVRAGAIKYLKQRQGQMRYGQYRVEGLPVGSGAVESSCKQMVTARCKEAGMRWSEAGVDAILALRSYVLNERLDELCPKPEINISWAQAA